MNIVYFRTLIVLSMLSILIGSKEGIAYDLSCGQFTDPNSPHARISVSSEQLNVKWIGFVGEAPWFALNVNKELGLPLAYLNSKFGLYEIKFSVPLKSNTAVLSVNFNSAQPDLLSLLASTPQGEYGSAAVVAEVTFMLNPLKSAHYSVPIEFLSLTRARRHVKTATAFGSSETSDNSIVIQLASGSLVLREPCSAKP